MVASMFLLVVYLPKPKKLIPQVIVILFSLYMAWVPPPVPVCVPFEDSYTK